MRFVNHLAPNNFGDGQVLTAYINPGYSSFKDMGAVKALNNADSYSNYVVWMPNSVVVPA